MSVSIEIFCRSEQSISRSEIIALVQEGYYFDSDPKFEPSLNSPNAQDYKWDELAIYYDSARRPVIISLFIESKVVEEMVSEAIEHLETSNKRDLSVHIAGSKKIFRIEIASWEVTEECWQMLACLEALLASELDGLIMADEGIYNKELEFIAKL